MGNSRVTEVKNADCFNGGKVQYSYIIDTDSYFLLMVVKVYISLYCVALLDFTMHVSCSCNVCYSGLTSVKLRIIYKCIKGKIIKCPFEVKIFRNRTARRLLAPSSLYC